MSSHLHCVQGYWRIGDGGIHILCETLKVRLWHINDTMTRDSGSFSPDIIRVFMEDTVAPPRAVPSSGKQLHTYFCFPGSQLLEHTISPLFRSFFPVSVLTRSSYIHWRTLTRRIVKTDRAEYLPTSTGPGRRTCHCNQVIPYQKRRKGKSSA